MSEDNTFHQQSEQNVSAESFGTVRNDSEHVGSIPKRAEEVGSVPNLSEELERVEKYSLTVREVSRMFEESGVPRTERSIVKWCSPNQHGVPRLTCRYEPNDRRWLITEESVRLAIAEEVAKQREAELRNPQAMEQPAPDEGNTETAREGDRVSEHSLGRAGTTFEADVPHGEKDKVIREPEFKLRDEQIASRAKDMVINRMEQEHIHLLDQVAKWSRQVGVLETRLLQIEGPKEPNKESESSGVVYHDTDIPNDSEQHEGHPVREGE